MGSAVRFPLLESIANEAMLLIAEQPTKRNVPAGSTATSGGPSATRENHGECAKRCKIGYRFQFLFPFRPPASVVMRQRSGRCFHSRTDSTEALHSVFLNRIVGNSRPEVVSEVSRPCNAW